MIDHGTRGLGLHRADEIALAAASLTVWLTHLQCKECPSPSTALRRRKALLQEQLCSEPPSQPLTAFNPPPFPVQSMKSRNSDFGGSV